MDTNLNRYNEINSYKYIDSLVKTYHYNNIQIYCLIQGSCILFYYNIYNKWYNIIECIPNIIYRVLQL